MKMAIKQFEVTLTCELVANGQYYLNGTRLHFDEPWAVYIVNGDLYMPYYRIYISNELRGFAHYDYEAFQFLLDAKNSLATRV